MRIAITGGRGIIGSALARHLRERGDEVLVLTRARPEADEVQWDPGRATTERARLEGLDAVVHLAGVPIADRPWTKRRRRRIRESRLDSSRALLSILGSLEQPPSTYLGVSGLWRYGDRGEEFLDESDTQVGPGFLAELASEWEQVQVEGAAQLDMRCAILRLNFVLCPTQGVFPLMVKPFRLGFGGWLGRGDQYTPWITIRDTVGALVHLLDHPECAGPFNGTVPEPVRNRDFFAALGGALGRQVKIQAPAWALRGAFGNFAEGMLLASTQVVPRALLDSGYTFVDADISQAYAWLLAELDASRHPSSEA